MIQTLSVVSKFHDYAVILCTHTFTHAHMYVRTHTYIHTHIICGVIILKLYTHTHTHSYTCTCTTVCPSLSLTNGDVSYSPAERDIGSVATYTCNPGYRLSSPQAGKIRTCSVNGWSNQTFICERCEYILYSIGHAYMKKYNNQLCAMDLLLQVMSSSLSLAQKWPYLVI